MEILLEETRGRPFITERYTGFRERPFAGRFIHVTKERYRVSLHQGPWPPRPENFNIFFLGGSTTFGYGLDDDETVPSFLQSLLPEIGGRKAYVYNFGCEFYFSSLERILCGDLLSSGLHPDLVIVMDGLNEFVHDLDAAAFEKEMRSSWPRQTLELYHSLPLHELVTLARSRTQQQSEGPERHRKQETEIIDATLSRYLANKKMISSMVEVSGGAAAFVWHPVPTYHYDLTLHPFVKTGWNNLFITRQGYERAAEMVHAGMMGDHFIWCADIQANADQPLYVDKFHFTAHFSRDVAACIAQGLRSQHLLTDARNKVFESGYNRAAPGDL